MLKGKNGGGLVPYIKTLREIETMISQAQNLERVTQSGTSHPPEKWEEVLHMARIAPALLSCLHECQELLTMAMEALTSDPSQSNGAMQTSDLLEEGALVVDYCRKVLTSAAMGVKPAEETVH